MIQVITGNNDLATSQALKDLVDDFINLYGDYSIERFSLESIEYPEIVSLVSAMPFLSQKRLLILSDSAKNDDFISNFDDFISKDNDLVDIIIYATNIDKRLSYFKKLKKIKNFNEYLTLSNSQLASYIVNYVKARQGKISNNDAYYLVKRVGDNQMLIKNEIDKLVLYSPEITSSTINLLTEEKLTTTVFNLLDNVLVGNHKKVIDIYNQQKKLRVDPMQIFAMLIWQLHILSIVKTGEGKPLSIIASDSSIKLFNLDNAKTITNKLSFDKLKNIIDKCFYLDIKIKTKRINIDDAILYLLLSIN